MQIFVLLQVATEYSEYVVCFRAIMVAITVPRIGLWHCILFIIFMLVYPLFQDPRYFDIFIRKRSSDEGIRLSPEEKKDDYENYLYNIIRSY